MKKYNVAILGATGAVGMEMMKILEERDFPVRRLILEQSLPPRKHSYSRNNINPRYNLPVRW